MIRLHDIELGDISRYRTQLMGAAMLFIVLFHVPLSRYASFYGLYRCGNVGVDMFLFLSGMGLWFSLVKTPSLKHFFARRYVRVYPVWLVIALIYFTPKFHGNWFYLISNVAIDLNFWQHDDLTFWYVPAIMMLYTFAPFYIKLIRKSNAYRWLPVLMIMWCVMVQWVRPLHDSLNYLEIFWSRVPIFFIGINMGKDVMEKRTIEWQAIYLLLAMFAMSLGTSMYLEQQLHNHFPMFIERMVYIPLTVTCILLLNLLLRRAPSWLNSSLKFVGMISLEIYLIHVEFVLKPLLRHHLGYWLTFLLTFVIALILAWLLNKVISIIVNMVKRNVVKV